MSKKHKVLKTPACTIAVAGGKRHANAKHALLVAAFARKQGISFETAAGLVGNAVSCLLDKASIPSSIADFAGRIGSTLETAGDLLDALAAFGYIKAS